ncbi:helix-turn-helix domain-containing protein [Cellulomonas iranensis]|uniref:helix-turn-helix domain-containing protein n=1 Tax=Cellulomonas iranensis TaxID=76862 RepID=UPI003D7E665B
MGEPKPLGSYLHSSGADAIVIVPARVADWIARRIDLKHVRIAARGSDPEVYVVLRDLYLASLGWREAVGARAPSTSGAGSTPAGAPEAGASSKWVSTTRAAELLGITDRAVRLAISKGRIPAEQIDGRWRIDLADIEQFRAGRPA